MREGRGATDDDGLGAQADVAEGLDDLRVPGAGGLDRDPGLALVQLELHCVDGGAGGGGNLTPPPWARLGRTDPRGGAGCEMPGEKVSNFLDGFASKKDTSKGGSNRKTRQGPLDRKGAEAEVTAWGGVTTIN